TVTFTGGGGNGAAGTATLAGGQLLVWQNTDNQGAFTLLPAFAANSNPASVKLADLNHSGHPDILVANNHAAGQVTVFQNLSKQGVITNAVAGGSGTTITSANHGLQNGDQVAISGVQGDNSANGFFII